MCASPAVFVDCRVKGSKEDTFSGKRYFKDNYILSIRFYNQGMKYSENSYIHNKLIASKYIFAIC